MSDHNDDVSELNAGAVICGAVGGVVLSVIICVFCIMLFWMRRSYNNLFSNKGATTLGSDIKMTTNPSFDIIKHKEIVYDHELFKSLKANPSYGVIQQYNRLGNNGDNAATRSGCNDAIQPYSVSSKLSREIYEDQDGYVITDSNDAKGMHCLKIFAPTTQEENPTVNDVAATDVVNMTNPSYNLVSGGVILEDNPSYNKMMFTQSH